MSEKILIVDDDANILAAYRRQFHKEFKLELALGGEDGLSLLKERGPFAVIVADMHMPGMNGIQFLAKAREHAPDTVRIMLSGYADFETAIGAVNQGYIFSFLTKPCPPETMAGAIYAGVEQYRLVSAERELLEKTLSGTIAVLTEVLGLVNPEAFGRASRIRRYVNHITSQLHLHNAWQIDAAAMLSQIGCVTLPPDALRALYAEENPSPKALQELSSHPVVARKLLENIPRLGPVARMIEGQNRRYDPYTPKPDSPEEQLILLGSQILKVALDLDRLVMGGLSEQAATAKLRMRLADYNPLVLTSLDTLPADDPYKGEVRNISLEELQLGMTTAEDIWARNGSLVVPKGQLVTYPVLARLRNYAQEMGVEEPFRVRTVA